MKKPTATDVARLAGVSQASVSLILNGNEKISFSQETKERVFAAAGELGYKLPVRKKREKYFARMILVFIPTLTNAYYSELIQYVEERAQSAGCHVIVCNTFRKQEMERFYLDTLINDRVVGIIYAFLPSFVQLIDKISARVPVVIIGEKQENLGICSIGLNNISAGTMLAEYLYQLGHRKFAFFSTPLDQFTMARSQRLEGIRRLLESHDIADGLDVIVSQLQEEEHNSPDGTPYEYFVGRELTARFLDEKREATAIIAVNDLTAMGVLAELRNRGCRIPEDYSVCGFDNIFSSSVMTPSLTTVEHHLRTRCQAAADLLMEQAATDRPLSPLSARMPMVNRIEYTPQLIVRQSTGPAKQ